MTHILQYLVQDWDTNRAIDVFNKMGVQIRISGTGDNDNDFSVYPDQNVFLTTAEAVLNSERPIWHGGTMGSGIVSTPEEGIKSLRDYFM